MEGWGSSPPSQDQRLTYAHLQSQAAVSAEQKMQLLLWEEGSQDTWPSAALQSIHLSQFHCCSAHHRQEQLKLISLIDFCAASSLTQGKLASAFLISWFSLHLPGVACAA